MRSRTASDCARATDLVLVRVRGEDRIAWLNGQITNDVRSAQPGSAVYALAVTVRGKIMADVWALDRGEELGILLPASARAEVLESFERQIIMEDVELSAEPALRVLSLQGPRARELASELAWEHHRCDELGSGGLFVLARADDQDAWPRLSARVEQLGGTVVDEGGFELARLRAGRARFGKDFSRAELPAGSRAQEPRGVVQQGLLSRPGSRLHAGEPRQARRARWCASRPRVPTTQPSLRAARSYRTHKVRSSATSRALRSMPTSATRSRSDTPSPRTRRRIRCCAAAAPNSA